MKNGNILRKLNSLGTFGKRLKYICHQNGIKQEELSKAVHYSIDTVGNWYRDKTFPDDAKNDLPAIIHFLRDEKHIDISLDCLLCLDDARTHDTSFIMKETGLSENAVQYLHRLKPQECAVLDKLLSDGSGFGELIRSLADASNAQHEINNFEKSNDIIELHINDNLAKEPPEIDVDIRTGWTDEAISELNRLETMLSVNTNGIEAETMMKDLTIRKFYKVLENFVPDIVVKKWTMDYLKTVTDRIHQYNEEMLTRKFSALRPIESPEKK